MVLKVFLSVYIKMPEVCLRKTNRLTHVNNIINLFKVSVKKYYTKMNN